MTVSGRMEHIMIDLLKQKIADAELVLVGVGEEWSIKKADWLKNIIFSKAVNECSMDDALIPFLQKYIIEERPDENIQKKLEGYEYLERLLKDKNYFIVTLCTDSLIHQVNLRDDRIVAPCGTIEKMQCIRKCTGDIYEFGEMWVEQFGNFVEKGMLEQIKLPVCPKCGGPLVLNTIEAEEYAEEGYLPKWNTYTKWLQGTVNKRLCILELGVGMQFPTVIRWPFEKVAFFNQKSSFFRVHSKLYQVTEEIKERSYGIQALSEDFLKELFYEL